MSYGFSTYRCGCIRKMFCSITKVSRRNVYKFLKVKIRTISKPTMTETKIKIINPKTFKEVN